MSRDSRLWILTLTGPAAWFVEQCANFALAPWACTLAWKPALYAVSIAALIVTAAAGFGGWVEWRQIGEELPAEAGGAVASSRTMATAAIALSAMFVLVIVAHMISEVILSACD